MLVKGIEFCDDGLAFLKVAHEAWHLGHWEDPLDNVAPIFLIQCNVVVPTILVFVENTLCILYQLRMSI